MLRVVLDTNIVTSAFRSRTGASSALMRLAARRRVRVLATPPLFLEYEAVAKRPEQLQASGLGPGDIDLALDELAELIEPIDVHISWRPQLHDPGDEMVLEAAINGRADALVTYNLTHFVAAASRFGILLASPADVLRMVRSI